MTLEQRKYKRLVVSYTAIDHNNTHHRQTLLNVCQRLYLTISIKDNSR